MSVEGNQMIGNPTADQELMGRSQANPGRDGKTAQTKVLHVIGRMDRGGAETAIMHVLRAIDRSRFEFHFFVHTNTEGAYDVEIRSLGARIHHCPSTRNPITYYRRLKAVLDQHGPFAAVH